MPAPALPTALYLTAQIRALELAAQNDHGVPPEVLMVNAGAAAFGVLRRIWMQAKRLLIVTGAGNNAGDAFVVARLAKQANLSVHVGYVVDPSHLTGAAKKAYVAAVKAGVPCKPFEKSLLSVVDVIVDGILGTGLTREVSDEFHAAIIAINQARASVVSLDIPSGVEADTGCVKGIAVHAQATITFLGLKLGLFTGEGADHVGQLYFSDINTPPPVYALEPPALTRLKPSILDRLKPRFPSHHKGDYGHVLVIGGNHGMAGAARLAAEAALRVGAGLVSVATRESHCAAITAARPEVMCHGVEDAKDLVPLLEKASVIVIGTGLGQDAWAKRLFDVAMAAEKPCVIDGDALNLLAQAPQKKSNWILTPHPKEAARLLSTDRDTIQADRLHAVRALQIQFGGVAVLKGNGSLLSDGTQHFLCARGNAGMATAGMGDVLSGVIAGLLGQTASSYDAAKAGVWLHGAAGDKAAEQGQRGLVAMDLMPALRTVLG